LEELKALKTPEREIFVCLICVSARQICCVCYEKLLELISERQEKKGNEEASYQILVTMPKGKSFRIYMNEPGRRKIMIKERIVPRDDFPRVIFFPTERKADRLTSAPNFTQAGAISTALQN
jgi:hypothetical protein